MRYGSPGILQALKENGVDGREYRTRGEARTEIFRYIEMFYNRERLHSVLGYTPPESHKNGRIGA
jgi:putative transposase